jgi:glucose-6-phosphate isomerase
VFEIEMPDLSARSLGSLIYFFELACAISAKFEQVNPFDQPGVEAYKSEMFRLLGRP